MQKQPIGGTIPGWFTVILLGVVCYMMKSGVEDIKAMLAQHEARIHAVEQWRAAAEGLGKK